MEKQYERIDKTFKDRFEGRALLVRSPGRVNLIGEHTDYNDGFVLPAAVDRRSASPCGPAAAGGAGSTPPTSARLRVRLTPARGRPGRAGPTTCWASSTSAGGPVPARRSTARSAATSRSAPGCLVGRARGWLAFALNALSGLGLDRVDWPGWPSAPRTSSSACSCGIMDQFATCSARPATRIRLDCRSLDYDWCPSPPEVAHGRCATPASGAALAGSEYNVRRAQCEEGVALLAAPRPAVRRCATSRRSMLDGPPRQLDPVVSAAAASSSRRTRACWQAAATSRRGDLAAFGGRMYGSHAGLRD